MLLGWTLDTCRETVQPFFGLEECVDPQIHDPLIEVLERLLNESGMYARAHGERIYVDMPYTRPHDLPAAETPGANLAAGRTGFGFWLSEFPLFANAANL